MGCAARRGSGVHPRPWMGRRELMGLHERVTSAHSKKLAPSPLRRFGGSCRPRSVSRTAPTHFDDRTEVRALKYTAAHDEE